MLEIFHAPRGFGTVVEAEARFCRVTAAQDTECSVWGVLWRLV